MLNSKLSKAMSNLPIWLLSTLQAFSITFFGEWGDKSQV